MAIVLADAHYERNEIAAARVLLDEHLDIAEDSCIPDLIIARLPRARAHRADRRARRSAPTSWWGGCSAPGEQRGSPRLVASALLEKSRIALAEGRVETAAAQVREARPPRLLEHARVPRAPSATTSRIATIGPGAPRALPRRTGAIAPLEAQIRAAEAAGRVRRALKLRGLLAQALWLAGQRRPAMRELRARALAAAAPEGLVRVLADEPWVLADMLENEEVHARSRPRRVRAPRGARPAGRRSRSPRAAARGGRRGARS